MTILFFEGAGMDFYEGVNSNVGNFRIRTAFTNLEGKQYYIELGRGNRFNAKGKSISDTALHIDFLFEIIEGVDGSNNQVKRDRHEINKLDYSKEDITKWINENLNCNFETIQVIDRFYGYHVHDEKRGYNLMENIELNHIRANHRRQTYNRLDEEYRELLNEKYSVISLMDMTGNTMTIRTHVDERKLVGIKRMKTVNVFTGKEI